LFLFCQDKLMDLLIVSGLYCLYFYVWFILQRCADMSSGNALLLNSIMSSFRAGFVAARAVELARKIRDMDDVGFPRHLLYCSLGQCVAAADPPDDQKLVLLNEVYCSV